MGRRAGSDYEIPAERLPEGFAERVERPPSVPAVPHPAATVALLRPGRTGMEVLLLRRNRTVGFVPGAYVFPGGRVDHADADPSVLVRLDGLAPSDAARRLRHRARTGPSAVAYYVAAVREAFEETGILMGRTASGNPFPEAFHDARVRQAQLDLVEGRLGFAAVLQHLECRIDGAALEYIAHWITPEVEPRRYDTRFFAAAVGADSEPCLDGREMTHAVWLSAAEALRRNREGALPLVFPTIRTLEDLRDYESPRAVLEAFGRREIPTILPRLVRTPTGVGLELP